MSTPVITLKSGLLEPVDPSAFKLDSLTQGVLDSDVLGEYAEANFEAPIKSITISRGRSRQLDRFNSGSATIVFNNYDRKLDPLNTASAYYDRIFPRLKIQIFAGLESIFFGFVTDWDIGYDISDWDVAAASLSDPFTILANFSFDEDVTPDAQTPADRLLWVLQQVGYTGLFDFEGGSPLLGAYEVTQGTGALDYMFQVANSDRSFLFVDAYSVLRLVGITDRAPFDGLLFADDGTGIDYQSLTTEFGDELLYNRVISSSPAGSVVVEDPDSILSYGVSTLSLPSLLNDDVSALRSIAGGYLSQYSEPQVRFTGLTVELAGLSNTEVANVLDLDLLDQVRVKKSFAVGSPASVTQNLIVSGITHQISADSHRITFSFEPTPFKNAFYLDNVTFGILDGNSVLT